MRLEHDSLQLALDARLDEPRRRWLSDAREQVASSPAAIAALFPAVGRGVGRGPLEIAATPATVHTWTVDDAARALLLVTLGDHAAGELELLYRHGDSAERRGVLRALAFLEIDPAVGLRLVEDALRTNDTSLIAAAMGPFAAEHLDDAAYAHGVLKCVFTGVPLAGVTQALERTTPELSEMLCRYAHERIAASRTVPIDIWPLIDRHPPAEELEALEAELHHHDEDRREAARTALAERPQHETQNQQLKGS